MMLLSLLSSFRNARTASAQDSLPGTLRPRAVDDIQSWIFFEKRSGTIYCVGSLSRDKYLAVPDSKLGVFQEVIAMFDGTRSLDEIQQHLLSNRGLDVEVKQAYVLLRDADLLEYPRSEHVSESEFKKLSIEVLAIDLTRAYSLFSFPSRSTAIAFLVMTLGVITAGLLAFPLDIMWSVRYYQFADSYSLGLLFLTLGMFAAFALHEFSHGWVATLCGLRPKSLKMSLYLGFMMFYYLEIRGIYTVRPIDRLKIWSAGIYSNLFLGCLFLVTRQAFSLSGWQDEIVVKLAMANFLMIVTNLVPFVPTDGYFIMCTLAKTVNLRSNVVREFGNLLLRRGTKLGIPVAIYAIISLFLILNAFSIQVRWLWQMILRLSQGPSSGSLGEYMFSLVFVAMYILAPLMALLMRRRWSAGKNLSGGRGVA